MSAAEDEFPSPVPTPVVDTKPITAATAAQMVATLRRASGDAINHPPHYTFGRYEPIDVIDDWGLGFSLGNAVKYIARAGRKDPTKTVEDLKKARFYIDHEIKKHGG